MHLSPARVGFRAMLSIRASTAFSAPIPSTATRRSYTSQPQTLQNTMSWPEFFSLRKKISRSKKWGGIPFVFASWAVEGFLLSLPIFDPTRSIMSVDPMVVVGIATLGTSIGSYVLGTALVGKIWSLWRPSIARTLNLVILLCAPCTKIVLQKQKDFYDRISKYRANVPPNPTQMNFNFDYYGEKIQSVADYRTWLRRQKKLLSERSFPV